MKNFVLFKTKMAQAISFALLLLFAANSYSQPGELVFSNSSLFSGTAGSVGAVYKFPSVNADLDALVKISAKSHSQVQVTNIDLTNTGFGKAFQPRIKYNGNVGSLSNWWMEFEITFVNKNTTIPATISSFDVTALDIDGDNDKIREWDAFYNPNSYTLESGTALTVTDLVVNVLGVLTNSGKTFTSPNTEYNGIDTVATELMTTLKYNNTSTVKFRLGGTANGNGSGPDRMYSIWFKSFNYQVPVQTTLPLDLLSFTATLNKTTVDLKWTTVNEVNVSHFIVERSVDGKNFSDAGLVFAYGNTSEKKQYSLPDNIGHITSGVIYYRLRSFDIDGQTKLSDTRIIRVGKQKESISLLTYPNPVMNELRITIPSSWQNKAVKLEIFNSNGQLVKTNTSSSANQTETMQVTGLAKGLYVVRASSAGEVAQQSIIKF